MSIGVSTSRKPRSCRTAARGTRSRRGGRSSSASPGDAGPGSGTPAAAPPSRWSGPRQKRRRLRARQELQPRGDHLDLSGREVRVALPLAPAHDLPSISTTSSLPRAPPRASRPRRRQRARSKTTCTIPLRSPDVRKMSSPRSRRRATQPLQEHAPSRVGRGQRARGWRASPPRSSLPRGAQLLAERGPRESSPAARSRDPSR